MERESAERGAGATVYNVRLMAFLLFQTGLDDIESAKTWAQVACVLVGFVLLMLFVIVNHFDKRLDKIEKLIGGLRNRD